MIENKLPKSWIWVPIVELLAKNSNGKPFQQGWSPQCHSHPASSNHWGVLKTTAIQDGEFWDHENKELPESLEPRPHIEVSEGDILMTCAGPRNRCGVVCFVKKTRPKLLMSGKMYRFRPNSRLLDSKYLEGFIRSHHAQHAIDSMKTGISDSGLNLTHGRFAELMVPFAPLNEQKRIVAKIEQLFSELDVGIAALKTAREQLKTYRQTVLKHAFEGKLTEKWRKENADKLESPEKILIHIQQEREAYYQLQLEEWKISVKEWETSGKEGKKPSKPRKQKIEPIGSSDSDDLFDIPEQWKWVFLNEISEHIVDGTHHTPDYTGSGIPFISAKDIKDFKIDFGNTRFIDEAQHKKLINRCKPRKNSVLLTKSGTIGRVALVDSELEFSLFESVANIPLLGNLQGRFVMWAVYFQVSTYFGVKNQKGVAVRHLHLEDIRRLPVPLPSYNEQTAFVERIENVFERISENEAAIDIELLRAETLRQSILKKAFSGKLVPQDPHDDPASELLARVQEDKLSEKEKY
ncbi:restriction endonuclease subunit S [Yersinia alsatica]|uniref:restriction endonuclease subunit S n=1 Tax=Yersinia TaxID=629 RepID=UPI0011A04BD6|nr:restriction endonuclease subunit S [Yersinia enterocolitica]